MDILRYQRMVKNGFHRFSYGLLRISETIKPRIEIHSAETYHIYRFLFDAARLHVLYHLGAAHVARTAIGMCNDHDLFHPQLVDSHHKAAYNAAERMRNDSARILYHLYITVLYAQSCRQQFGQTGVHTGKDGDFLIGIFIGDILLISLILYKPLIVFKNIFYHSIIPVLCF